MPKIAGVDFGGTWLRVGLVNTDKTDETGKWVLQNEKGKPDVYRSDKIENWDTFAEILCKYAEHVEGYGIAIAGPIDEKHETVIKAPNLPWLGDDCNVREELQKRGLQDKTVVVSNDMEAAAEGERKWGRLKDCGWALFDTISTGWGGVLILAGELVLGEPGHVNVSFDDECVCGCGNVGCNEARYSGTAMERRIRRHLHTENIVFPDDLDSWKYFYKELETNKSWAVALLAEWAEGVGRAWANVLNRIPRLQKIVYMGPTAEGLIPRAKERIYATIRRISMFEKHKNIPIEPAEEENRSIYGAVIVYRKYAGAGATSGGADSK